MKSGAWSGEWVWPARSGGRRLIVYCRGGGILFGSSRSHQTLTSHLARFATTPVLSIDYRLLVAHTD